MYKRIVSLITILVIGMIGLFDNVSAEEVSPYLLYTDTYSSTLTISGATATCKSKCTQYADLYYYGDSDSVEFKSGWYAYSNGGKCKITVTLKNYTGTNGVTITGNAQ